MQWQTNLNLSLSRYKKKTIAHEIYCQWAMFKSEMGFSGADKMIRLQNIGLRITRFDSLFLASSIHRFEITKHTKPLLTVSRNVCLWPALYRVIWFYDGKPRFMICNIKMKRMSSFRLQNTVLNVTSTKNAVFVE